MGERTSESAAGTALGVPQGGVACAHGCQPCGKADWSKPRTEVRGFALSEMVVLALELQP
jgi:hypothetical protein